MFSALLIKLSVTMEKYDANHGGRGDKQPSRNGFAFHKDENMLSFFKYFLYFMSCVRFVTLCTLGVQSLTDINSLKRGSIWCADFCIVSTICLFST